MQRIWLIILAIFIIGGHIAMWTSDMPRDLALRLTLINAAGWAVILIPVWMVSKWAAAHQKDPTQPRTCSGALWQVALRSRDGVTPSSPSVPYPVSPVQHI